MEDVELEPCPFCGAEAKLHLEWIKGEPMYLCQIECSNEDGCAVFPCINGYGEAVITTWNTRHES